MINKITVLVHGPYSGNKYNEIFYNLQKSQKIISEIVISTYEKDIEKTNNIVKSLKLSVPIKISTTKDLINPGYFNLNRQIICVQNGLKELPNDSMVVKLRNDQWINLKKLYKIIQKEFGKKESHRIITTNCFTRKDRFYHPSDMFLSGWCYDLKNYYSLPLQEKSHLNFQFEMIRKLKQTHCTFNEILVSPESELFKNYLLKNNWELKYTDSDSFSSIKQYMKVINTWDISLKWGKKRNAILPANTIILPYHFKLQPFPNAPKENAICYSRSDFEGRKNIKDLFYLSISWIFFEIEFNTNYYNYKQKWIKRIKKLYYSRCFPNFMRQTIYTIYKRRKNKK